MSQNQSASSSAEGARLAALQQTESLPSVLKRERTQARDDYDCLSCRVMGQSTSVRFAATFRPSADRKQGHRHSSV